MTRDELLEALLTERMTNPWWTADATPTEAERQAAEERRQVVERGRIRRAS